MFGDRPRSKLVRWLMNTFGPDDLRLEEFTMHRVGRGSDLDLHARTAADPELRIRVQVRGCRIGARDGVEVVAWDAIEIDRLDLEFDAASLFASATTIGAGHVAPAKGVPWFVGLALGREN